jgi:t-SNARE complex subunit (syntaxin)
MPESVQTGGLKSFSYREGRRGKLNAMEKKEIEEAYAKADDRKARQKKMRVVIWLIIIAILLVVVWGIWFFIS